MLCTGLTPNLANCGFPEVGWEAQRPQTTFTHCTVLEDNFEYFPFMLLNTSILLHFRGEYC